MAGRAEYAGGLIYRRRAGFLISARSPGVRDAFGRAPPSTRRGRHVLLVVGMRVTCAAGAFGVRPRSCRFPPRPGKAQLVGKIRRSTKQGSLGGTATRRPKAMGRRARGRKTAGVPGLASNSSLRAPVSCLPCPAAGRESAGRKTAPGRPKTRACATRSAPKGRPNKPQAEGLGLDYTKMLPPALKGRNGSSPMPASPTTSSTCGIERDCSAPSGLRG